MASAETKPPKEECNWAMYAHLSAFLGALIPLAAIIAPLLIWQTKKEEMPFVADQAKEGFNFQISVLIYLLVSSLLMLVMIGFLTFAAVAIMSLVFTIIAAVKSNEGQVYRYPLTIRFIK